jgi:outer membrane protein OmpA-like peptidoglycan-associated protein
LKIFIYIFFIFYFSLGFSQEKRTLNVTETVKTETTLLNSEFYKKRYNEEDLLFKIVDNYGNKFDKLYGTRNVRPILHGIAYRGGGNNYFHKTAKRKNQNALPDDGITNLCQEGFSKSVYLYQAKFNDSYNEVTCNCIDGDKNNMEYLQLDYFDEKHIYQMLKMVHESATKPETGPVYLHCWNGWHASGFISAIILKQFCGYNSIDAVKYWDLGTDGANSSPHYQTIRKQIRDFVPYPEFNITDALGNKICPPMPKTVNKNAAHIDIEQLLIVPEAVLINSRIILYDVIFAPNSTSIKNVGSIKEIKTLIKTLKKYPDLKVEIGGHTDRSGNAAKNKTLSKNRALFIYKYLANNQISKNQISFKGYGSSFPAYSNNTKAGRKANRRIEVKVLQKKDYGNGKLVDESVYESSYKKIQNLKVPEKGESYVLESLKFAPNKTNIKNLKNKDLVTIFNLLQKNKTITAEISGYTDASGIKIKNDSLSIERAKSVYNFLIQKGIDSSRLTYKGYGPLKPIADNKYKWGRDKNRRIELKIIGIKE